MARKTTKRRGDGRERLIAAAAREFNAHGYGGTDSNRIAARAGFAPQTFYRHFKDKLDIFAAVYRRWEDDEQAAVAALVERGAGSAALADAIVAHHRAHLLFRRALRTLSLETKELRLARAASRRRQIDAIVALTGAGTPETLAILLFQIERLADAIAEGEFADLGMSETAARAALARILSGLRSPPRG